MRPLGSCTRAMLAADATRSDAVRTPGSSGTNTSDLWFVQVDHEALAHDRVECPVDDARRRRLRCDVPDQHAVVEARQRMIVTAYTDSALQPPVRRVQPVRMVRAIRVQPDLRQLRGELAALVDAD